MKTKLLTTLLTFLSILAQAKEVRTLKPIDTMELLKAVDKATEKIHSKLDNSRMLNLLNNRYREDDKK